MLILISVLKTDEKTVVGYRFYVTGKTGVGIKDVSKANVEKFLSENKCINAELVKKEKGVELKGTNGTLERYPVIDASTGKMVGKCPIIIVTRLNDGFRCLSGNGQVAMLTNADALAYSKINGVSNGKITKIKGTETISAISGNYAEENINIVKKEAVAKSKYTDEFYARISERYGENKTALIKYLIEKRDYEMETLIEFLRSSDIGCVLAGIIIYTQDLTKNKPDLKLVDVLKKNVEPSGLLVIKHYQDNGVDFMKLWDTDRAIRYNVGFEDDKYSITRTAVENKALNYMMMNADISPELKIRLTKEKRASIEKLGKIIGINPVKQTVTYETDDGIHSTDAN